MTSSRTRIRWDHHDVVPASLSRSFVSGSRLFSSSSSSGTTSTVVNSWINTTNNGTIYSQDDHEHDDDDDQNGSRNDDDDTIFALSSGFTGDQATALAVIRISGRHAHNVLAKLLQKDATSPSSSSSTTSTRPVVLPQPRQATLRNLYFEGTLLDQALVLLFRAPYSFTGEDVVELHCHGSRPIVKRLLEDVLPSSSSSSSISSSESTTFTCRMADPGEFTQRAYQNGKLDLVQVEALADVLTADTTVQVTQALQQLDGQTSQRYEEWRSQLISGLAHAEAVIDFGDDEHLGMDDDHDDDDDDDNNHTINVDPFSDENLQRQQMTVWGDVAVQMKALYESMQSHLKDGRRGEMIREGLKVAIVGPPNAGKSSLFNILARKEAAIVSPIAGTTRDVLQLSLDLGGVKCTLYDTAGVRSAEETSDVLELEGMKRAMLIVDEADLVVAMMDATAATNGTFMTTGTDSSASSSKVKNDTFQDIVQSVLENGDRAPEDVMLVLNKLDLVQVAAGEPFHHQQQQNDAFRALETAGGGGGTFEISCQTQEGIDFFLDALSEKVVKMTQQDTGNTNKQSGEGTTISGESAVITRARHRQHVEAAAAALERFLLLSGQGSMAVDMAAEELRLAASELGRITGAVDVEDVLDELFSTFCIGK